MNEDGVGIGVPPAMALAWGVAERAGRGPKRTLSLRQVLDAGIGLAVEQGLSAVSMARVAERVGVSTMALYRYVPAKDDLLELMVDTALGAPPALPDGTSWRDGLRLWAEGCRDRYRAHPWALQVPITGPPLGPNNVRWLEFGLAALRETALSDQQKLSSVLLVSAFVRGEEAITADILARIAETGRPPEDYDRLLGGLIDPVQFPELHRAIGSGALADEDPDDIGMDAEFEFGLERILDGVDALVRSARRRRRAPAQK
jgi:AcrR family transcriptional regulator